MKIDLKIIKEQNFVLKAPPYDLTKWALPSELEDDSSKSPEAAEQVPVPIDTPAGEEADGPVKSEEDNILEKATAAAKNLLDATLGDSGGTEGAAGDAGEVPIDLSNCNDNALSYLFGVVAGSGTGASARIGSTALRNVAKSVFERDLRRMIDVEFPSSGNSTLKKVAKSMKNPWVGIPVALAIGATSLAAAQGSDSNNEDIKTLSQAVNYFKEGKWADGISEAGGVTDCFWVAYTIGLLGGVGLYGGAAAGIRSSADIVSTGLAASARGAVATAKGATYLASKATSGAIGVSQSALAGLDFMGRLVVSPGVLRTIRSSSIEKFKDGLQLDLVQILQTIRRDSSISLQMPGSLNYDLFDIEQLREIVKYQKDNLGTYQFVIKTERLNGIVQAAKDAAIERAKILRDEIEELDYQIKNLGASETAVGMGKDIIPKRLEYEKLQDIVTDDRLASEYQRALSLMVGQLNEKYVRVLSQHALTMAKQSNFQSIKDMEEFLKIIRSASIQRRTGSKLTQNETFVYKIFNKHTSDLDYLADTFMEESLQFTANNKLGPINWRRVQGALDKLPRDATPEQIKSIAKKLKLKGANAGDDLVELHLNRTLMLSKLDEVDGLWQLSKNKKIVFRDKDKQRLSAQELLLDDEKFMARALRAGRKVARALRYESGAPVANYPGLSKGASTSVGIKSTGLSGALDSVTASGTFLGAIGVAAATGVKVADSLSGEEGENPPDDQETLGTVGSEIEKIPVNSPEDDVIIIGDSNAVPMAKLWYGKGVSKKDYDKEIPAYTYLLDKQGNIVAPTHGAAHPMYIYNQTKKFFEQKGEEYKPKVAIIHMGYNVRNSMVQGFRKTVDFLKQKGVTDIRVIDIKVDESKFKKNSKILPQIKKMKQAIRDTSGITVIKNNGTLSSDGYHFYGSRGSYSRILNDALNGVTIEDDVAKPLGNLLKSKVPSELGVNQAVWDTYRMTLGKRESSNNYSLQGGAGGNYDGRYQIGVPARRDASSQTKDKNLIKMSRQDFRSDPEAQEKALRGYTVRNLGYLNSSGKHRKLWDRLKKSPAEKMAILAVAHLLGHGPAKKFLINNLKSVAADGNGTRDIGYYNLIKNSYRGLPKLKPGTKKTTQKEVKQMSKKDLRQIVSEVLNENSGQGYAPYPYGSSVRDDEEPKEDYIEEWKALSMEVIRDESRNTAIEIAKILVKDLELFEDVLDLAGQNQSIGTEILTKLKQSKEKA